jgi:hypothetical protein
MQEQRLSEDARDSATDPLIPQSQVSFHPALFPIQSILGPALSAVPRPTTAAATNKIHKLRSAKRSISDLVGRRDPKSR